MMNFLKDESGAVTIDWVALAAGLLILGVAIVGLLTNELQQVIDAIESSLGQATSVSAPSE
ncbi:MAG: hypothetical protein AAFR79_19985 [Pseudomonadota bacterium]